jgi:glycine cleavage system regulatory protein
LVDLVAGQVVEHGGNWLESRMCALGGEFAGILRVTVPGERRDALIQALNGLAAQGLTVVVRPGLEAQEPTGQSAVALEIVGQDRPGIVHQISAALARREVNVQDLHTAWVSAPMSGEPLFKAEARLQVPASCSLSDLRQELERIAEDLVVDLSLQEIEPAAATR